MTGPVPSGLPLPAGLRLAVDPSVRRLDGGRVLIGGSPLRILRLTAAGTGLFDRWAEGAAVGEGAGAQRLARRLLEGGLAHPRLADVEPPFGPSGVAVVIPVHGEPAGLARALEAVLATGAGEVVVVDDGSPPPAARRIAQLVGAAARPSSPSAPEPAGVAPPRPRVSLLRREENGGPAAARNAGTAATVLPVVAFVDADVVLAPGCVEALLAHLADPAVAAVAPRVRADPPSTLPPAVAAYERHRSPLDRGAREAPVRPRSRVSYVPTAALIVRREALDPLGGFDPGLRFGEDVDLVWRLVEAGWTVRYEPAATAAHPGRPSFASWLGQRFAYGRSAAPLAERHGGAVAPLTVSGWSAAGWGLVAAGAPGAGAGLMAATTAALVPRLRRRLDRPGAEAVRLAGLGNLHAGRQVASALRRAWAPLLALMLLRRRSRLAAVATLAVPPILDRREAGATDPGVGTWTALSLADDLAYGAGLWAGAGDRRRSATAWRAVLPSFSGPLRLPRSPEGGAEGARGSPEGGDPAG